MATRDIVYVVASPLERAQETAAPIAAEHDLPIAVDESLIESRNVFQGQRFPRATAPCVIRAIGGTCATRALRRGASPTVRSPNG